MSLRGGAIYTGRVVHKRLRPKPHALSYGVFCVLLDAGKIGETLAALRLMSRNRFNLFSFYDSDHGAGDGTPVLEAARRCLEETGRPFEDRRIDVLCYPRVLGYVFNPLSVFYVYDLAGALETLIYQVNNTFGERTSYVVPAGSSQSGGVYAHSCRKVMYVSPFADGHGSYMFRVTRPDKEALVAVLFADSDGALIKTHFRGTHQALSDKALLANFARYPLLTFKVIAAIHYEALKLWLKGVPLTPRHVSPRYAAKSALEQQKG